MKQHVFPNAEALSRAAADFFEARCREAVDARGRFTVVLTGGSSPQRLHALLAKRDLPWADIFLFWGDERCVPLDHPDSNAGAALAALVDRIPIPSGNVFPMPGELPPVVGATRYAEQLTAFFDGPPVFDLVWLGLGDDGHVASLFPHATALEEQEAWVLTTQTPEHPHPRLTLTVPALRNAHWLVFIAYGAGKAEALRRTLSPKGDPRETPARLVVADGPDAPEVHGFFDEAILGRR